MTQLNDKNFQILLCHVLFYRSFDFYSWCIAVYSKIGFLLLSYCLIFAFLDIATVAWSFFGTRVSTLIALIEKASTSTPVKQNESWKRASVSCSYQNLLSYKDKPTNSVKWTPQIYGSASFFGLGFIGSLCYLIQCLVAPV